MERSGRRLRALPSFRSGLLRGLADFASRSQVAAPGWRAIVSSSRAAGPFGARTPASQACASSTLTPTMRAKTPCETRSGRRSATTSRFENPRGGSALPDPPRDHLPPLLADAVRDVLAAREKQADAGQSGTGASDAARSAPALP